MPTFTYKAKKGPEEVVRGEVEAPSRDHAVRQLSEMGYVPVQVTEIRHKTLPVGAPLVGARDQRAGTGQRADLPAGRHGTYRADTRSAPTVGARDTRTQRAGTGQRADTRSAPTLFFARIRSREVTIFTRQMASLFRSHVPILRALTLLGERSTNPKMKALLGSVYQDVKDGAPLSVTLQKFPHLFPSFYVSMVRSGEMSGQLDEILDRLAHFREKEEEFQMRVRTALAYPAFMLLVGALTILVLLTFVMPRLLVLFKDMQTTLPLPTRILLGVSGFLSNSWPFWGGGAVVLILLYGTREGLRNRVKSFLDRLKLQLPVIRTLVRDADMERFGRTLSFLLKSGLAIVQAVEATVATLENEKLRRELQSVSGEIRGGASLSAVLSKIPTFPPFVTQMIAVGEEGGRLEEILVEVANDYEVEVEQTTKVMTALLEPILILVLGLVVGFIVAAMLLPIFELNMAG